MGDIRLDIRVVGAATSDASAATTASTTANAATASAAAAEAEAEAMPRSAAWAVPKRQRPTATPAPARAGALGGAGPVSAARAEEDSLVPLGRNTAVGKQHLASIGRRSRGGAHVPMPAPAAKRKLRPLTGIESDSDPDDDAQDPSIAHTTQRRVSKRQRHTTAATATPTALSMPGGKSSGAVDAAAAPRRPQRRGSKVVVSPCAGVPRAPRNSMQITIRARAGQGTACDPPGTARDPPDDALPTEHMMRASAAKFQRRKPTLTGCDTDTDGDDADSSFGGKSNARRRKQGVSKPRRGGSRPAKARGEPSATKQKTREPESSDTDFETGLDVKSFPTSARRATIKHVRSVSVEAKARKAGPSTSSRDRKSEVGRCPQPGLSARDSQIVQHSSRVHNVTIFDGVGARLRDAWKSDSVFSSTGASKTLATAVNDKSRLLPSDVNEDPDSDSPVPLGSPRKDVSHQGSLISRVKSTQKTLVQTCKSTRSICLNMQVPDHPASPVGRKEASPPPGSTREGGVPEVEVTDDTTPRGSQTPSQIDLTDALQAISQKPKKPRSLLSRAREAVLRERMSDDELGRIRVAFCALYPPPPSNMAAQGRYEVKYGREMSRELENALWLKELKPWSDRWWELYQLFNDDVRARKMQKNLDRTTTVTDSECSCWANMFYDKYGDARVRTEADRSPDDRTGQIERDRQSDCQSEDVPGGSTHKLQSAERDLRPGPDELKNEGGIEICTFEVSEGLPEGRNDNNMALPCHPVQARRDDQELDPDGRALLRMSEIPSQGVEGIEVTKNAASLDRGMAGNHLVFASRCASTEQRSSCETGKRVDSICNTIEGYTPNISEDDTPSGKWDLAATHESPLACSQYRTNCDLKEDDAVDVAVDETIEDEGTV